MKGVLAHGRAVGIRFLLFLNQTILCFFIFCGPVIMQNVKTVSSKDSESLMFHNV